ncbi:MAG: GrpB family protein [Pseudomonadota bacterium]
MPLTSTITPYDPNWPELYRQERDRLLPAFACFHNINHIGSTAVPGLAAKPEIDIMLRLTNLPDREALSVKLSGFGYRFGTVMSDGHYFYKRDHEGRRTHKLHILQATHPHGTRMIVISDRLRENSLDRQAYEALKLKLEAENTRGIVEYLEGKAPFLDATFEKYQAEKHRLD